MAGLMEYIHICLRSKEGKKECFPKEKKYLFGKRNSLKDIPTTRSSTLLFLQLHCIDLRGHNKW